jgi:hypothetical protein
MAGLANFALDGGDPRLSVEGESKTEKSPGSGSDGSHGHGHGHVLVKPQTRPLHDPSISFEE